MNDRSSTQPIGMPLMRRVGGSELTVFPVGISSASFAGGTESHAAAMLDTFAKFGGDLIATRSAAGSGVEESLVGAWLGARRQRERMVLVTDVDTPIDRAERPADAIERSVDASLERLGTDIIDVLILPSLGGQVELERTLVAAHDLIADGRVRYLAAKGLTPEQLLDARIIAAQGGLPAFIAVREQYSLLRRGVERYHHVLVQQQGLGLFPSTPIDSVLGDESEVVRAGRNRGVRALFVPKGVRQTRQVRLVLDQIAAVHGVRWTVIALAWLLSRPGVAAPIVRSGTPELLAERMDSATVLLTRHQLQELDRATQHTVTED